MPAWALLGGGAAAVEWFTARFIRARELARAAGVADADNFDTIIPEDFGNTITSELADVVGNAEANPSTAFNAGVVTVQVGGGDDPVTPNAARLQLTGGPDGPPSHVGSLSGKNWYVASLVLVERPPDEQMGDTVADAIGLWNDSNNRVGLGILGNASGGSTTNWVGYVDNGGSFETSIGPALDPEGGGVWHLFEAWKVGGGPVRFALDGINFATSIDASDVPDVSATLSMYGERSPVAPPVGPVISNFDKACVIVRSPRVGEVD